MSPRPHRWEAGLCPVCSAHYLSPRECEMTPPAARPLLVSAVLPIVTVEAKRVGVVQRIAGPLREMDWRATPMAMEMECERFARAHDTPLRNATHYWWGVRCSRRVWVMPHAEPQVLVAEDYVRGDATYERLQRMEARALRALFREQHALQAWRVRDDEGQPEPAHVLWTVRLEQDGYPTPLEARTAKDRREFRRAVESLPKRLDVFSWAVPQQEAWRP